MAKRNVLLDMMRGWAIILVVLGGMLVCRMPLELSSTPSICLCFSLFQGSFAAIEKISRVFYFQNGRVCMYRLQRFIHC